MNKQATLFLLVAASFATGCEKAPVGADTGSVATSSADASPAVAKEQKVYEGPFGLTMGLSREAVGELVEITPSETVPSIYHATTLPTPHPDFESYVLQFSETDGLCSVLAIGNDISTGDAGAEVKSAFDSLVEAVSGRYGKGKRYDFYSGAGSGAGEYWMMYLSSQDQTLAQIWNSDSGATLPTNISAIGLEAKALDMNVGYVNLKYEFSNFEKCVAETDAAKSKAL